jgi:hypothetical protein
MNSVAHDREKLSKLEKEFERAVVSNDATAVRCLLADDWIIVGSRWAHHRQIAFSRSDQSRCFVA